MSRFFKNGIAGLTHKEQSLKLVKKRPILNIDPLIDDHRLRSVGKRLENSTLPFDVKHLIILPRCFQITELIIDHFHKKVNIKESR